MLDGKADVKGRPAARRAFDPNPAAMRLDDIFHDREPEPGAAGVAGSVLVDAVEPFEDVRLVVGGNAGSVVGDADTNFRVMTGGGDADAGIFGAAMSEGVAEQVGENFLNPGSIDFGLAGIRFPVDGDFRLAGGDIRFEVVENPGEDVPEVIRAEVEEFGAFLQA